MTVRIKTALVLMVYQLHRHRRNPPLQWKCIHLCFTTTTKSQKGLPIRYRYHHRHLVHPQRQVVLPTTSLDQPLHQVLAMLAGQVLALVLRG